MKLGRRSDERSGGRSCIECALILQRLGSRSSPDAKPNVSLFDGRIVDARDARGTIALRVTERLCIDAASGAQFAYTGRMSVDGGADAMGCGAPLIAGQER
jgi:hypothetical protein